MYPFIPEQTDDNTPIHDKKFKLPSSGEESLTPASVTPVITEKGQEGIAVDINYKKRVWMFF